MHALDTLQSTIETTPAAAFPLTTKVPPTGRAYVQQVTDLDTGEVTWETLGMHYPLSAVAYTLGIGPRKFRAALKALGMLADEYDTFSRQMRGRITPWVVENGFGKRIERKVFRDHEPFDVLSEQGVEYVRDHLPHATKLLATPATNARTALRAYEATRVDNKMRGMDVPMRVSWLADHHPDLRQIDIADIVGATQPHVAGLLKKRDEHRRWLEARQNQPLQEMAMAA